jgi:ATP-dependent Lon protease
MKGGGAFVLWRDPPGFARRGLTRLPRCLRCRGVTEVPEFQIEVAGEAISVPTELPLLPVRHTVFFPGTTLPLSVGRPRSTAAVRSASGSNGLLAVLTQRKVDVERPGPEDLYEFGTVTKILQVVDTGSGLSVVTVGLARFRVLEVLEADDMQRVRIEIVKDVLDRTPEAEAARRTVQQLAKRLVSLRDDLPDELQEMVDRLNDPARLADTVAFGGNLSTDDKVALLGQPDVLARLRVLVGHLMREIRVAEISRGFQERAAGEIDEGRRKALLREQLRKIQEELGESDEQMGEVDELRQRVDEAELPDDVLETVEHELGRLGAIPAHSPERSVIRTYIEWILDLPWTEETDDDLDLEHARRVLDEDHYDLERVKDRVLEYLAVRRLVSEPRGPILCLLGPPGVGKTSVAKSIARAMSRRFTRMSLGGVRDEAEIRGHRRTYVGALPGRIVQGLKNAASRDPVFVLDEIDKVGADYRGDPSSALLEVLDPEQNSSFSDHYLEIPFDLSRVLFVATANRTDTIPPPLLDRMELIEIPGYTAREKLRIGSEFLIPRQLREHGLEAESVAISESAQLRVIEEYTREAGVRNQERQIAALVRKAALGIAEGAPHFEVDAGDLEELLGPAPFTRAALERIDRAGVAIGLVWTPVGGDIVFVESALLEAKPGLHLTGQLGDVMRESAELALSYLRANAETLAIDPALFEKHQIHVHVPAGAMPKDGPSAGITMLVTLASLLTGRPVRSDVCMTGEITLRGQVLAVGGIKEKLLAAHRAGISNVILPSRNRDDIDELPDEVREALELHFVDETPEAVRLALTADA